jgi:Bacterial toxin 50/LysM domain
MASIDGNAGSNRSADTSAHVNTHDNTNNTSDASSPDRASGDVAVAERPTTAAPPNTKERPVKSGDTLRSIAEEEGITVQNLYELNPGLDPANHDVPMERMQAHWDVEYLQNVDAVRVPEVILADADGGAIARPQKLDELPDASVVLAEADPSMLPGLRQRELTSDEKVDVMLGKPDVRTLSVSELVARTQADLRATITGPEPLTGWSLVDKVRSGFDDIKVGYAMGSIAAKIEATLDSYPAADRDYASQYAEALRGYGDRLSFGAARGASPNAAVFAYKGQCYESANALAAAVMDDRFNPTGPTMSEWTPEMQEQSQIAAMDREIWNRGAGIGFSWAETGYMIARGHGANASELRRAYAAGQLGDIALGLGTAFAPVIGTRNGLDARPGSTRAASTVEKVPDVALKKVPLLVSSEARAIGIRSAEFPGVGTKISKQVQDRHILGTNEYAKRSNGTGSYFKTQNDAQAVLDAFHSGAGTILGKGTNNAPIIKVDTVTGFNNNPGAGFLDQPTNVFMIKGTTGKVSVVPMSPAWKP